MIDSFHSSGSFSFFQIEVISLPILQIYRWGRFVSLRHLICCIPGQPFVPGVQCTCPPIPLPESLPGDHWPAWPRTEHWLSCMSVSCLTPYWTLALLYVSQLPDSVNQPRPPSMSVSCLILWMNPGSLACQTVAWSCDNPGSLACQSVVWPSERTLDPLHVSQLPDSVNELWLSCISITLPVRQYSEGCGKTEGDMWATKEKNKPKQRMTV